MRKQRTTCGEGPCGEGPPDCEHDCASCEKAYRRGVHQAYVTLRQFLEKEGGDPLEVLAEFERFTAKIRRDRRTYPALLHQVWFAACNGRLPQRPRRIVRRDLEVSR